MRFRMELLLSHEMSKVRDKSPSVSMFLSISEDITTIQADQIRVIRIWHIVG